VRSLASRCLLASPRVSLGRFCGASLPVAVNGHGHWVAQSRTENGRRQPQARDDVTAHLPSPLSLTRGEEALRFPTSWANTECGCTASEAHPIQDGLRHKPTQFKMAYDINCINYGGRSEFLKATICTGRSSFELFVYLVRKTKIIVQFLISSRSLLLCLSTIYYLA
jgi:hypothetical protein